MASSVEESPRESFAELRGPDGLASVTRRFANSVEVVRYAMEFYKGLADLEEQYATGLAKLLRSPCYTFKQHFLMQWLGNESTEELGSLNSGWVKLGRELQGLVGHHRTLSKDLMASVRQPLEKTLPKLDQLKLHLKTSSKQLTQDLEVKEKQHTADKKRYDDLCKEWQKLEDKLVTARAATAHNPQVVLKAEQAHTTAQNAMLQQENKYRNSVTDLSQAQLMFERQSEDLLRQTEDQEIDRVKLMKTSFLQLAKSLSNTAPIYLEGMQRMLIFTDAVDARCDVETFVHTHSVLKKPLSRPLFHPHPKRATAFADYTRPGSTQFGAEQTSPVKRTDSGHGTSSTSSESFVTSMEGKTSEQKLKLDGRPDLDEDEPLCLPEGLSEHEEGLMRRLLELSRSNDFYGLLGAAPSASKSELAKARRQKTLHLHPDHFAGDPESKKSASEALSLVNQIYTDLLTKDTVRSQYDQLCAFRLGYIRLPLVESEALAGSAHRLNEFKSGFRKARAPANLVVECEQALMVVNYFLSKSQSSRSRPTGAMAATGAMAGDGSGATMHGRDGAAAAAKAAEASASEDGLAATLDVVDAAVTVHVEPKDSTEPVARVDDEVAS